MTIPQASQNSAPPVKKSHAARNVFILIVVLALFFLAPVVPYTFASYSFLGATASATGYVSPSYAVMHCGLVADVQASYSGFGYSGSLGQTQQWSFTCGSGG